MSNEEIMQGYTALTTQCGLVDLSDRTQIELTGEDRVSFLHNLCSNDIKQLEPGRGCEAYITSVRGKVIAHVFVFCGKKSLIVETASGQGSALMAHLDRYIITEDVELHDRTADWCEFLVSGPRTIELLTELNVKDPPSNSLSHIRVEIGVTAWLRRVPILIEPTFLVSVTVAEAESAKRAILDAGAVECVEASFQAVRIEAGYPWFPIDFGEDNLPQEVARDEQAISFEKGCYLGQETIARLDALGHVNQILTLVKVDDTTVPELGAEISCDGKVVGHVTSTVYSPRLKAPIALTILRCSALNSPLQIGDRNASVLAQPAK